MVSAGVLSGDDVRRLLENTTALLTAAGAVDFDDGQTIAEKIAATPEDFMTWSRKRTSTRKVAVGVISVCKALAGLEDALTGMRGYTPAVASPPIGIHLLTPPVAHPLEQLTTVNLAPYTSKPKTGRHLVRNRLLNHISVSIIGHLSPVQFGRKPGETPWLRRCL